MFTVLLGFVLHIRRKSTALIASISSLVVFSGFGIFYAYADTGDKHLHKWLRSHIVVNNFLFTLCNYSFGLGYYILIVQQWMTSFYLTVILAPGSQSKLSATQIEEYSPELEELKIRR
jgi:hypothetical protein